ncbi:MAG: hypothetical protein AB1791_16850 [Chloroflexota bacterium]
MDIQHLVDRLEQTIGEGKRIPLTAGLIVDETRLLSIIDQMRVAIPEEIKRANRIEAEKERILAQAKEEAERIRSLAKQEAAELVKRDSVIGSAQQRAESIIERARRDADNLRHDADAYVVESLSKLEEELLHTLAVVRNGLRKVEAEHEAVAEPAVQS